MRPASHTRNLTVAFDAECLTKGNGSGVAYYTRGLISALAAAFPDRLHLVGHYYSFLGRKRPANLPMAANISYKATWAFPERAANMLRRLGIPVPFELLIRQRSDILLFTNFLTQSSLFGSPIMATIHDLCFLAHPEFVATLNLHDLERYVPQSIKRAAVVLAVSEFTKRSVIDAYRVDPDRIVVTPIPPLPAQHLSDEEAQRLVRGTGIAKQYILFVGNIEPRKNLLTLVEAYARCPERIHRGYSLVLAGGKGWKSEGLHERIAGLRRQGLDIVMPGYVSDMQKTALYQQAALVVAPSYYEGFGMPILEAFSFRVPVAASDIPAHREVADDALAYFSPASSTDMAAVITEALEDSKLRGKLVAREAAVLRRYSWHNIARRLFSNMEELAYAKDRH